ncbi:hypothetical protein WICPIJ_003049 [Wickerhamomyces pijperi]|uniref:Uncharacterized protein n=1 Tax=Wickerhamomyces pijperi TaxID=599730 RepID=A0A9P8Q7U1_WICPI|nr:hypothetical protein WICPIJ_003049 [Wickerhamomyces pijperi]
MIPQVKHHCITEVAKPFFLSGNTSDMYTDNMAEKIPTERPFTALPAITIHKSVTSTEMAEPIIHKIEPNCIVKTLPSISLATPAIQQPKKAPAGLDPAIIPCCSELGLSKYLMNCSELTNTAIEEVSNPKRAPPKARIQRILLVSYVLKPIS